MIDHDPNFYIKRMTFPAAPIYFLQHSSRVNPYSIGGEVTVVQPAMGPGNTSRNEDVATDSLQLFRTFGSFPGARERREFPLAERRGPHGLQTSGEHVAQHLIQFAHRAHVRAQQRKMPRE